jgi:DNA mismatch repair protein MutL
MSMIRILADRVANQIAAGEVVERPASVVKELLENSVDAGAQKIEVEFRNGGKSYIRVEDDGMGMSPDQALLSLERHATSKIREAGDLNRVKTFGFRGEALPSIASVSRFTLRTRSKVEKEGCEILLNGGKMIHVKECGMPPGTRIEVAHLFNSVPGRRKFLKTEVTESTHLMHLAKLYALAHPQIHFTLMEGGRTIFKSPACEDLTERVREIFGRGFSASLGPIENSEESYSLSGLVGLPGQSRPTRKEMIFFVNHRPVDCKTLTYATIEAFHTFIPKGRFPPAILFLEIDPASVDVNVHPSKKEIRFREEAKVRNFLLRSLLDRNQSLSGKMALMPKDLNLVVDSTSQKIVPQIDPAALHYYGIKDNDSGLQNPQVITPFKGESALVRGQVPVYPDGQNKNEEPGELIPEKVVGVKGDGLATWRLIDRPSGDLGLFSTPDGLVALHARAAYERIRFEELEDCLRGNQKRSSQALLLTENLELDSTDSQKLKEEMKNFNKLGFEIEEFGRNFFRVTCCPHWLSSGRILTFIKDYLELACEQGNGMKTLEIVREAMIRDSLIKAGQGGEFSDQEMILLAKDLLACRNPFTCPKGSPTYFEIPHREFESRFRRKL